MLAIATNLPEIAITVAAAASHHIGVATGNILGGIAIQTVVLVALDAFGRDRRQSLTYRAASLGLVSSAQNTKPGVGAGTPDPLDLIACERRRIRDRR